MNIGVPAIAMRSPRPGRTVLLALRQRRHPPPGPEPIVATLDGGAWSLARRRDARRLITVLPEHGTVPLTGAASLLPRLQARRSVLLLAGDRDTAVSYALAWRLDPERIRVVGDGPAATAGAEMAHAMRAAAERGRPWHSRL